MGKIITVKEGDVFKLVSEAQEGDYQVLMHGCNCFCNFGAGFALGVKEKYPAAFEADRKTPKGDMNKMGRISWAGDKDRHIIIVNAYTQYRYGKGGPHFEYGALRSCIARTVAFLEDGVAPKGPHDKYSIIMPMIGCGYAGGNAGYVVRILQECAEFHDINITVVMKYQENKT